MKQRGIVLLFAISFVCLIFMSVFLVFQGRHEDEWKNQTMLRMEVPYEKEHPTGRAAEYFARLVSEESDGQMEVSVAYNTNPGSAKDIATQLQFGGIAFATVNFLDLCEDTPQMNRFIVPYASPEEAQAGYHQQKDAIQESLSKERMEILSCYRPDYRCIASQKAPESENDFSGLKIHATKAPALMIYLSNLGAEIESFDRMDLLRAVDSGYIDGSEMPFLFYSRAGYDKVMPYIWVYEDLLIPDVLVASTVSLGNLTATQRNILLECAGKTEASQVEWLNEAQQRQWELLNAEQVSE